MGKAPADEDSDKAAPVSEDSRSYPTFRNIATKVAKLLRLGNAKKKFSLFSFALPSFIRNFAIKVAKLLPLDMKKE